jgi:hypothetical protein
LGGEHDEAAEMIFIDQRPEIGHSTPVIIGERNETNVWNRFFR